MNQEREINKLRKAWLDRGPRPDIHVKAQIKLKEEWPTLYKAIIDLL